VVYSTVGLTDFSFELTIKESLWVVKNMKKRIGFSGNEAWNSFSKCTNRGNKDIQS
jgi:hypothetical protein